MIAVNANRRRRIRLALLAALALLSGAAVLALLPIYAAQRNWRDIRARGVLLVGIDASWQPFSFFGASGWEGFDADLTDALGTQLGLKVQSFPVGFDSRYDALKTGLVDLAISAVVVDPTQTQDAAFSRAYFDAGPRLLAPLASRIRGPADLNGARVGVSLGSAADRSARFWERRSAALVRSAFADDADVITQLRAGALDAAMIDGLEAVRLGCPITGQGQTAEWRCVAISPNPYVIAVRASDTALLDAVNKALDALAADGTVAHIARTWIK